MTTTLPMGDVVAGLEPGLYALTARVAGGPAREDWEASATQWFVVTDLGLATLTGADGLHVFLRGLSDAAAREGVEVTLLARNNDVLGRAVTDAEGHARFDPGLLRGRGGAEAALVTAEAGQDFAFLSLAEPGLRPLRPRRRRAAGTAAGRRLRHHRARRLPAGRDGVRDRPRARRPGPRDRRA